MRHLGLFEGIGGFSLAVKWMDWKTVAWCEINEFCQTVLKYHFPDATGHADIRTTDFSIYRDRIDIITGGFPCQPYSSAGQRKGTEDDRHLWPEMLRVIRDISPKWIVGENVLGITNWNGGVVFEQVQADLEVEGYEVQPFILPACSVNAPHRRDRVWFIAHSTRCSGNDEDKIKRQGACTLPGDGFNEYDQREWITESPVFGGNDGLPEGLAPEAVSDYVEKCTTVFGNAIVPHIALQIFKAIEQYEKI